MQKTNLKKILLDFYGVTFEVMGYPKIVNNLKKDFEYFLSNKRNTNILAKLNVYFKEPPINKLPKRKFYSRKDYQVYSKKNFLYIFYDDGVLVVYNYKNDIADIYSNNFDVMYEISYLFIQSKLGELLEQKGIYRIHSFGFSMYNKGYLFMAPLKGGKSSLGIELLKSKDFYILSDDTPFIDKNFNIWPFPIRIGINDISHLKYQFKKTRVMHRRKYGKKTLLDLDYFKNRIGNPVPLSRIFLGKKYSGKDPLIRKASLSFSIKCLFIDFVIGFGIPQIREFIIRPDIFFLLKKLKYVIQRIFLSFRLLLKVKFYVFYTVNNFEKNKSAILRFLEEENAL